MKIAIISDVHGNLPALEAAVADACARGAKRIICAGDLVGYGPFPSEVCGFVAANRIDCVSGNFDRKTIESIDNPGFFNRKMNARKRKVLDWTLKHVDGRAQGLLRSLPQKIELKAAGHEMLIVHGSPDSDVDTIYPSITSRGLESKLGGIRPGILACGHTHIPFARRMRGMLVVNCGSAGFPVDGDPRPSFAMLELARGKRPSARIFRYSYDVSLVVKAIARNRLPETLLRDFAEGIKRM